MPGIFDLEPTDERIDRAQPVAKVRSKELGYFLGALVSTVTAVLTGTFILSYLQVMLVHCWMSLGCSDRGIPTPLLLAPAAYLLLALLLAALAQPIFKTSIARAFLLNVAPLIVLIAMYLLLIQYRSYSYRSDRIKAAKTAIGDAPAVHLGDVFIRKVESPGGGVTIFVHVPFTVSRPIQARSMAFLATPEDWESVKFSSMPQCNFGFPAPSYGFHLVEREYSESPLPSDISDGPKQLAPNKQYYLLQERHFSYSLCRVTDYEELDPKELRVKLTTLHAEDVLNKGGE